MYQNVKGGGIAIGQVAYLQKQVLGHPAHVIASQLLQDFYLHAEVYLSNPGVLVVTTTARMARIRASKARSEWHLLSSCWYRLVRKHTLFWNAQCSK